MKLALLLVLLVAFMAHAQNIIVRIDEYTERSCTLQSVTETGQSLNKCSSGEALQKFKTIKLSTSQRANFKMLCTTECIAKVPGCVAFTAPSSKSSCTFYGTRSETCGSATLQKKRDTNIKVLLTSDCWQTYTRAPTQKPTGSPIPKCVLSPENSAYDNEFRSLEFGDLFDWEFKKVKPDAKLCELMRLARSQSEVLTNFNCDLSSCLRWCKYEPRCMFAEYNPTLHTCMRATSMELTDDSTQYATYFAQNVQTYTRYYHTPAYYSGKCNELVKAYCSTDKECTWNRGKRGYNDQLQGGSAGGFCGRTKCLAYRTTKKPTPFPTHKRTKSPTNKPTKPPTRNPTSKPTTARPTMRPTTAKPTKRTGSPTFEPTALPTAEPTFVPTLLPTQEPTTLTPTTLSPTRKVTSAPTKKPSKRPTDSPTKKATKSPTRRPTKA